MPQSLADDGYSPLDEGRNIWVKKDKTRKVVLIRTRIGDQTREISFDHFNALCDYVDDLCLACSEGDLEDMVLKEGRFNAPMLVCNECGANHVIVDGELEIFEENGPS